MDFKALMSKLEKIDKTVVLTEAEKKETTWTDKSGKKHSATAVKGDKYTGKDAEKEMSRNDDGDRPRKVKEAVKQDATWTDKSGKKHSATRVKGDRYTGKEADKEVQRSDDEDRPRKDKKKVDESIKKGGIAEALLREFGMDLEEAPAAQENPWAHDPRKAAAWDSLSDADKAFIGGADPTDKFILARAPNKGQGTPKAAPTVAPAQPADARNGMDVASDAAAAAANAQPADARNGSDVQSDQAAAAADAGQAGQPQTNPTDTRLATGAQKAPMAAPKKGDPKVLAMQKQLIAKGAKIVPDGIMGPQTQAAMKQFGMDAGGGQSSSKFAAADPRRLDQPNQTANTAVRTGVQPTSTAGAGRGSVNPAPAQPGGMDAVGAGQAAQPAGGKVPPRPGYWSPGGALTSKKWDQQFGATHNQDGTPKSGQAAQPGPDYSKVANQRNYQAMQTQDIHSESAELARMLRIAGLK